MDYGFSSNFYAAQHWTASASARSVSTTPLGFQASPSSPPSAAASASPSASASATRRHSARRSKRSAVPPSPRDAHRDTAAAITIPAAASCGTASDPSPTHSLTPSVARSMASSADDADARSAGRMSVATTAVDAAGPGAVADAAVGTVVAQRSRSVSPVSTAATAHPVAVAAASPDAAAVDASDASDADDEDDTRSLTTRNEPPILEVVLEPFWAPARVTARVWPSTTRSGANAAPPPVDASQGLGTDPPRLDAAAAAAVPPALTPPAPSSRRGSILDTAATILPAAMSRRGSTPSVVPKPGAGASTGTDGTYLTVPSASTYAGATPAAGAGAMPAVIDNDILVSALQTLVLQSAKQTGAPPTAYGTPMEASREVMSDASAAPTPASGSGGGGGGFFRLFTRQRHANASKTASTGTSPSAAALAGAGAEAAGPAAGRSEHGVPGQTCLFNMAMIMAASAASTSRAAACCLRSALRQRGRCLASGGATPGDGEPAELRPELPIPRDPADDGEVARRATLALQKEIEEALFRAADRADRPISATAIRAAALAAVKTVPIVRCPSDNELWRLGRARGEIPTDVCSPAPPAAAAVAHPAGGLSTAHPIPPAAIPDATPSETPATTGPLDASSLGDFDASVAQALCEASHAHDSATTAPAAIAGAPATPSDVLAAPSAGTPAASGASSRRVCFNNCVGVIPANVWERHRQMIGKGQCPRMRARDWPCGPGSLEAHGAAASHASADGGGGGGGASSFPDAAVLAMVAAGQRAPGKVRRTASTGSALPGAGVAAASAGAQHYSKSMGWLSRLTGGGSGTHTPSAASSAATSAANSAAGSAAGSSTAIHALDTDSGRRGSSSGPTSAPTSPLAHLGSRLHLGGSGRERDSEHRERRPSGGSQTSDAGRTYFSESASEHARRRAPPVTGFVPALPGFSMLPLSL
ncbi:hypothetical protein CXG81DRAFT_28759 [Caulochytrium protostelioides]|uniref:Uncharacterized protein n=1 Tax=Caulochytrium protostelioides TaxID=1555241 RepID=A0A4P9WVM4_9FUNG|nr:hypothetical protein CAUPRSCDRAFT_10938 [Caulochytrium protostelioides]RKO98406.1 hypothetical protein CXG81DRAFT_28759 [Caulochytrium protostelioides]|eukprot:RKO98406.1 hypothetical protein CXG81DRAFT_28759 [Caulochytrium protostelioides]